MSQDFPHSTWRYFASHHGHHGSDELFIAIMGSHAEPRKISKKHKAGRQGQKVSDWSLTLWHQAVQVFSADGNAVEVPAHSLVLSSTEGRPPVTALGSGALHSWLRVRGSQVPNIWQRLGLAEDVPITYHDPAVAGKWWQLLFHELTENKQQDSIMLTALLTNLLRACQRAQDQASSALPVVVVHLQQLLAEESGLQMNVAELASRCACSAQHLTRLCRKHFACSLSDLRRQYRLQCAADLITSTQLSLQTIAERVGYSDAFSLSKAYKNIMVPVLRRTDCSL